MVVSKIVVLDIDGVLRSWPPPCPSFTNGEGRRVLSYNPMAVQACDWLLRTTGALLVVSSTWRNLGHRRLSEVLRDWGLTYPVDSLLRQDILRALPGTETWERNDRTVQLRDWLTLYHRRHPEVVPRVVILDDDPTTHGTALLIQTSVAAGLTWQQAQRARDYLEGRTDGP